MTEEKTTAVVVKPTVGTEGFSLLPRTFEELTTFVKLVAQSDMVPKSYQGKPENVMVAIQMGADVGLKPLQALQSIAVINGMPSLWGDGAIALCYSSGALLDIEERSPEEALEKGAGWCRVQRKGMMPIERSFSTEQAKAAGIWGKNVWASYPGRMLQMRARALALRDRFADVLRGLYIAEEAQDIPVVPVVTEAEVTPTRKSETKKSKSETVEVKVETAPPPGETKTVVPETPSEPARTATDEEIGLLLDAMKTKKLKAEAILTELKKRFEKARLGDLTQHEVTEIVKWIKES